MGPAWDKKAQEELEARLHKELRETETEYRDLLAKYTWAMSEANTIGLEYRDGADVFHAARGTHGQMKAARERYSECLRRFTRLVVKRSPDDEAMR